MPIVTNETLTRLYNKGEVEISRDLKFIVDRITIPLVAGQGNYVLPDYIIEIRRITYFGKKVWPLGQRIYREVFQGGGQKADPFWYIYNNVLSNTIQLFPAPPGDIPNATGDLFADGIPTGFIIEFNRISDNVDFILPSWIRNRILKRYVAKFSFLIEGPNQNLKLAQYFNTQYANMLLEFKKTLDDYMEASRMLTVTGRFNNNYFPGAPILSIDKFGIGVDLGE